jgi:hypothetical protein
MFEILPESEKNCIGFTVQGKLDVEDYKTLLAKVDETIQEYGYINLLAVMGKFEGWTDKEAAKMDFEFGTNEYRQVKKAAFVGDKKRQEWMIKIMDPLTRHTKERFFTPDQLDEAWKWIKEESGKET